MIRLKVGNYLDDTEIDWTKIAKIGYAKYKWGPWNRESLIISWNNLKTNISDSRLAKMSFKDCISYMESNLEKLLQNGDEKSDPLSQMYINSSDDE